MESVSFMALHLNAQSVAVLKTTLLFQEAAISESEFSAAPLSLSTVYTTLDNDPSWLMPLTLTKLPA